MLGVSEAEGVQHHHEVQDLPVQQQGQEGKRDVFTKIKQDRDYRLQVEEHEQAAVKRLLRNQDRGHTLCRTLPCRLYFQKETVLFGRPAQLEIDGFQVGRR